MLPHNADLQRWAQIITSNQPVVLAYLQATHLAPIDGVSFTAHFDDLRRLTVLGKRNGHLYELQTTISPKHTERQAWALVRDMRRSIARMFSEQQQT